MKKSYLVLSKILHDGKEYGPDDKRKTITLDDDDAEVLGAAGVLGSAGTLDLSNATAEERTAAILGFVKSLAIADFTAAGGLRADAKRRAISALGFEPTDEELRAVAEAIAKAQAGDD
ncbi:MAG: hypothetical protein GY873_08745 [Bosea sp.]|uniref:hypothetical protein n=1 Tax=Bosea sp. (in: a-proteobacteria) TaxID=1871050 RepID=UPI00238D97D8|nr:hypothetical protein [Bosea sp. (in: a-proteobacteria)]MCP4734267.1 hypothetical protein [Bosea sp. (in: a-proteobacteria)]